MNVILGTDGSRYARAAADFAARWLDLSEATVDVVAISPKTQPERGGYSPAESPEREWRAQAGRWMANAASPLKGRGVDLEYERDVGAIASETFVERIRDGLYDLAIVGAKGRSEEPHFAGRSVAAAALQSAPLDLLMVRAPDPDRQTRKIGSDMEPFRILFSTDGRAHSEMALRRFFSLSRIPSVRMRVVTVSELPPDFDERPRAERRSIRSEEDERVRTRLDRATRLLEAGQIPVEAAALEGDVADAVLHEARRWQPHLILLGSRGFENRPAAEASVAVSIAASAPCSVFLVRGDGGRLAEVE